MRSSSSFTNRAVGLIRIAAKFGGEAAATKGGSRNVRLAEEGLGPSTSGRSATSWSAASIPSSSSSSPASVAIYHLIGRRILPGGQMAAMQQPSAGAVYACMRQAGRWYHRSATPFPGVSMPSSSSSTFGMGLRSGMFQSGPLGSSMLFRGGRSQQRSYLKQLSLLAVEYVPSVLTLYASPCYWRLLPSLSWPTVNALLRRATSDLSWFPSLTGVLPYAHVSVLSALNLVGANLPRTLALVLFEVVRSTREAKAQAFDFYGAGQMDQLAELAIAGGVAAAGGVALGSSAGFAWLVWHVRSRLAGAMLGFWHVARLAWLMALFAPVCLSAPLALKLGLCRGEWMELLRRTLEAAGAFFIKWGQWAATRHDMFPPDMCKELAQLQIAAPAHRFSATRRVVEEAFGMQLEEVFDSIETVPVASGSIGQIHRAKLSRKGSAITGCRPGQIVAVKVRHPGTATTIIHDFETMLWVASVAERFPILKNLRIEDTLKQFAAPLKEQVDLAREASNLQRFNFNFRHSHSVRFPVPLYPLVSADVLVESFEEGEHITHYIESAEHNPYNLALSELGSSTMLQMMLKDNLIHSDLHPGNILVRLHPPKGLYGVIYRSLDHLRASGVLDTTTRARVHNLQQSWLEPQMILLDVGMATELSDQDQVNMVGLFRSFAKMDGRTCGEWTLRFSGLQQSCPDPEGFKSAMQTAFDAVRLASANEEAANEEARLASSSPGESPSSSSSLPKFRNTAEALANVLELIRLHQVSLPGHICAVVVTTLVLEGWSNKLDPDHSVLSQVQKMFEHDVPLTERIRQSLTRMMQEEARVDGVAAAAS